MSSAPADWQLDPPYRDLAAPEITLSLVTASASCDFDVNNASLLVHPPPRRV